MNKHRYMCFVMFFLSPILYPLCWWPMRYTGWVFWSEPNDIMKHLWIQMSLTFQQTDILRKREVFWIFVLSSLTFIPYWIIYKLLQAAWIVYIIGV